MEQCSALEGLIHKELTWFLDSVEIWRGWRGSNPRPLASEANTLSTELQPRDPGWTHRYARPVRVPNCRGNTLRWRTPVMEMSGILRTGRKLRRPFLRRCLVPSGLGFLQERVACRLARWNGAGPCARMALQRSAGRVPRLGQQCNGLFIFDLPEIPIEPAYAVEIRLD